MSEETSIWRAFEGFLMSNQGASMHSAVMANLGWLGYYVAKNERFPTVTRTIGGIMLSGFLAWFFYYTLNHVPIVPKDVVGPWSAMLASGGAPVYKVMLMKFVDKVKGEKVCSLSDPPQSNGSRP